MDTIVFSISILFSHDKKICDNFYNL